MGNLPCIDDRGLGGPEKPGSRRQLLKFVKLKLRLVNPVFSVKKRFLVYGFKEEAMTSSFIS